MIYLILPRGSFFGWGVCGKYITKELSKISELKYFTEKFSVKDVGDEFDYYLLNSLLADNKETEDILTGKVKRVDVPVLQAIQSQTLLPLYDVNLKSDLKVVGYTFFEENILHPSYVRNGRNFYDVIVTGSKWCEKALRDHGLKTVSTIIQGIDPLLFNSFQAEKDYFRDKFVVFSGGKFEFRKGQDIVIRAYKVLQDRHQDVMLVNSWFNFWGFSMKTMSKSPYIKFDVTSNDYIKIIEKTLQDNGIDLERVITLLPHPSFDMARIYKNTDVGLFPNRCEGGTNLVLMEYMACGKPVIASYNSGHKDIINKSNSIMVKQMKQMTICQEKTAIAVWDDPDLDETINHLEWAYQHREELKSIGEQAANDLKQLTWKNTAEKFYNILIN